MPTTDIPTREYSAVTIDGEFTRRRLNKTRDKKVHQKSWPLTKLTKADRRELANGGAVVVEGKNAGQVRVVQKAAA